MKPEEDSATPLLKRRSQNSLSVDFPYVRAWLVSGTLVVFYVMAAFAILPVISQYVVHRIDNRTIDNTTSSCGKDDSHEQEIQKVASSLTLYYSLVGGSVAVLTNIYIGPLSDAVGRKTIFLIPALGILAKDLIITFIVYYNLNLNYFYLAYGIDGLSGSYFAIFVAMFSYSADVTVPGNSRTIAITILEGCVAVASSAGQLATGFLIKFVGFLYPAVMFVSLSGLNLVIVFFLLPETVTVKTKPSISPLKNIKKVFGFYFSGASIIKRCAYLIALGVFFFGVVTILGRSTLETIYQLGEPFCWDSIKIGYYGSIRLTAAFIFSIIALKILQYFVREEVIGIISCLASVSGFLLEGFADTSLMMYLVPVASLFATAVIPITRATMSKMTLPSQQGALFASIAIVEAIGNSASYTLYNSVYNATVEYYRGIVWFVMAGLALVTAVFLLTFIWTSNKGNIYPCYEAELTINDDNYGNCEDLDNDLA
ncbi:solute carrier family 46 member 3 isoform X1 [Patella vulgata]|uniref:solute carrier family 46 member 3 isoform X1 n=2 Tax=Patella vulgata TaxID=6465 RepID=UPI00217FDBF8|nr:solute carrier family 46 member 3 isoform X1 [Patella vulgata]